MPARGGAWGALASGTVQSVSTERVKLSLDQPPPPAALRSPPAPLHGGPLTFLRFARTHHMFSAGYALLIARWVWLKLRWRGRLKTDGLCFICPGVKFDIGRRAAGL